MVFRILIPLLLAVGAILVWHARRRRKMVETFAETHGFALCPELEESVQRILDHYFALEDPGVVRSFGQLASLVEGEKVRLFRTIERLDLNPPSSASATHFPRLAALFDVSTEYDDFFLLDASLNPTRRGSGAPKPDPRAVTLVKKVATACNPRHTLSITLTHGHGLIYFEPVVTGGETERDLQCLYQIARQLQQQLSEARPRPRDMVISV